MIYCAVNTETNKTYEVPLTMCFTNVFMWRIREQRKLFIKAEGYPEVESFFHTARSGVREIRKMSWRAYQTPLTEWPLPTETFQRRCGCDHTSLLQNDP